MRAGEVEKSGRNGRPASSYACMVAEAFVLLASAGE